MGQESTKKEKGSNIVFIIIAVILGSALWKQFNFNTLSFEKPALAAVYAIALVASVYLLIREYTKPA